MKHSRGFLFITAVLIITAVLFFTQNVQARNAQCMEGQGRKKIKVLFIGNSLTQGPVISYVKSLGKAGGYKITTRRVAHGGEKLFHYADSDTWRGSEVRRAIKEDRWDFVIIQEHTDWTIARGGTMKNAIVALAKLVKKNDPDTKILLNCTWAYDYTRRISGTRYPYERQRELMTSHYKSAKKAVAAL